MNPETILDIYRRAWMLLGVGEKLAVIDALNEMEECATASRALLEDFAEWCRLPDGADCLPVVSCDICGSPHIQGDTENRDGEIVYFCYGCAVKRGKS